MKSIDPISPAEDIKPEPISTAQSSASSPKIDATALPTEQPMVPHLQSVAASVTDHEIRTQPNSELYPTPLTSEERLSVRSASYDTEILNTGFAFSQYMIPFIIGLYAMQSIWQVGNLLIRGSISSSLFSSFSGRLNTYRWLLIFTVVFQVIVLLYASYKVYTRSRAGLALVSGAALMALLPILVGYVVLLPSLDRVVSNTTFVIQMIASLLLLVALVLAWTKERSYYS